VRLYEPAADLAVAVSVASSFRDRPTDPRDVYVGEVGLTGEVRSVARLEQRLAEARQMGFQNAIVPRKNLRSLTPPEGLKIIGVGSVEEALEVALGGSIG